MDPFIQLISIQFILEAIGEVDGLGSDVVIEGADQAHFGDGYHHLFLPVLERRNGGQTDTFDDRRLPLRVHQELRLLDSYIQIKIDFQLLYSIAIRSLRVKRSKIRLGLTGTS